METSFWWAFTFHFAVRRLMVRDYKLITAIMGIAHEHSADRSLGVKRAQ